MNGLRHGLRAEVLVLLPGESEEKFRRLRDGWAVDLAPGSDVESYHVDTAVSAAWRRERCIRSETATLTDRVLAAIEPDPEVADAKARRLGALLATDPAAVAHKLRKTSAGCRWMLARWDDLAGTLDQTGFWEFSRLHLALNLLGFTAQQWRDEWRVTSILMGYLSARRGQQTTADDVRFALGGKPKAMSTGEFEQELETIAALISVNAEGRARLKGIVAEAQADLRARLEWVEAREARRRATAADRAAFDDSAEGQRRMRYEAMHARELRAALRDLRAEQARRMAEGDVTTTTAGGGDGGAGDEPQPDPIAPSEPTAEAGCLAPSEPTEDPVIAPSEPTEDTECLAPNEPTEGAPNEPTADPIVAPSEPTGDPIVAPSGPTDEPTVAPSEPTAEAPSEPTLHPIIAPSEPTEDAEDVAPSEPTDNPIIAPTEPTGEAEAIAPSEPTEAGEGDVKDDEGQDSGEGRGPAAAVERAVGPEGPGASGGEVGRPPAMAAGGGAVRLPSPFRSGGDGPMSVGLGRGYERSW